MPSRSLVLPVTAAEPVCREVLVIIQCYVDCECDVSTMLAVAAHIEHCPCCQEELAQLRWLKSAVRRCHQSPSGSTEREDQSPSGSTEWEA